MSSFEEKMHSRRKFGILGRELVIGSGMPL